MEMRPRTPSPFVDQPVLPRWSYLRSRPVSFLPSLISLLAFSRNLFFIVLLRCFSLPLPIVCLPNLRSIETTPVGRGSDPQPVSKRLARALLGPCSFISLRAASGHSKGQETSTCDLFRTFRCQSQVCSKGSVAGFPSLATCACEPNGHVVIVLVEDQCSSAWPARGLSRRGNYNGYEQEGRYVTTQ